LFLSWRGRGWGNSLGLAYKSVTSPCDGLDKSRLIGIVFEDLADFPDRGIDCVIGIKEDVLAPKPFNDLFPRYQLARPPYKQEQDFHGDSFQLQRAAGTSQLVGSEVQFEFIKFDEVCRHG
jgi:hypothetical protein